MPTRDELSSLESERVVGGYLTQKTTSHKKRVRLIYVNVSELFVSGVEHACLALHPVVICLRLAPRI